MIGRSSMSAMTRIASPQCGQRMGSTSIDLLNQTGPGGFGREGVGRFDRGIATFPAISKPMTSALHNHNM